MVRQEDCQKEVEEIEKIQALRTSRHLLDGNSALALALRAPWCEYPPSQVLRLHHGHEAGPAAARALPLLDRFFWPARRAPPHSRYSLNLIPLIILEHLGVSVDDFSVLSGREV
jgi:hypothetical protein